MSPDAAVVDARRNQPRVAARLRAFTTRAAMASLIIAAVELALVAGAFPAATSRPLGALLAFAELAALYTVFGLPVAWLLALADVPSFRRRLPSAPALVVAATLAPIVAIAAAITDRLLVGHDVEFPSQVLALREVAVGVAALGSSLAFGPAARRLDRVAERHPVALRVAAAATLGLGAVLAMVFIHFTLAPIHEYRAAGLTAVAATGLLVLATRIALPDVPRRLGHGVELSAVALALLGLYVPGSARDHARFVVYVGGTSSTQLATILRDLVDRDGDGSAPTWLGGTDCKEGDPSVGPGVRETPGDGVDQDCRGGDAPPVGPAPGPDPGPPTCRARDGRPSILLVVVDSMRGSAVGPATTPNLIEFGRGSQFFARAYSPTPNTETSFPSVFSARPLSDTGTKNPIVDGDFAIDATITERFRDAGYETAVFSDLDFNPICLRGFQARNPLWRDRSVPNVKHDLSTVAYARGLLDYLDAASGPTFVLLHLADVHAPYKLDRDDEGRPLAEAESYLRDVAYVDTHLGQLFARMQRRGLFERTVIAITADHGEELRARGREGHGANVFEEGTHVPLLLWVPGCAGRVVMAPTSTTRLGPTLGALAGVSVPGLGLFSPTDLPTVSEGAMEATYHLQRAVVVGRYKLIVDVANGGRMLFDLATDSGETRNIYGVDTEATAALERAYQTWLDAPGRR